MAARALQQAFAHLSPQTEIVLLDGMLHTPSPLKRSTYSFYLYMNRRAHWLWRLLYYRSFFQSKLLTRLVDRVIFSWEDTGQMRAAAPDAVVTSHGWTMKTAIRLGIPTFTVMTDYVYHPIWLSEKVLLYFVASQEIADDLVDNGIQRERIHLTGIPVRSMFWDVPSQKEARQRLGLPAGPRMVLLLSGNHGVTPVLDIARSLKGSDIFVLLAAGRNRKLERSMQSFMETEGINGRAFGYVEEMDLLISASDLVVTKAGGMITSECLASGTPTISFDPIPGQEEGNARMLSDWGAGAMARNKREAVSLLLSILGDEKCLREMRNQAKAHGRPRAGLDIARTVLDYMDSELQDDNEVA